MITIRKIASAFVVVLSIWFCTAQTTQIPTMSTNDVPALTPGTNIGISGVWPAWTANNTATVPLMATSGSISGGLTLGSCNSATVSVPGATTSMVAVVSPSSGTTMAAGIQWQGQVTATDTVKVFECGLAIVSPAATTFNVRVIP